MTRPCVWCCQWRTTPDDPDGSPVDSDGRTVRWLALRPHAACVAEIEAATQPKEDT